MPPISTASPSFFDIGVVFILVSILVPPEVLANMLRRAPLSIVSSVSCSIVVLSSVNFLPETSGVLYAIPAVKLNQDNPCYLHELAKCYLITKNYLKAEENFEKLVKI